MAFELGTDGPTAILVGVDGSPTSMRAAAYAAGLARRQHARLVAVYVRTLPSGLLSIVDPSGTAVAQLRAVQDEIEAELRESMRAHAKRWGVEAQLVVRTGDPLTILADVARDVRADAVIVGSSASVGHRLAGSLAVRLVRIRRWPVTVVP